MLLLSLFSCNSSMRRDGSEFLLHSIFTGGTSASLHTVLLLVLVVSWLWESFQVHERKKSERNGFHNTGFMYYRRSSLVCSLAICVFNIVLCLLSYFFWSKHSGGLEDFVKILDLGSKTFAWAVVCAYLHVRNSYAQEPSFPCLLRIWFWVYAFVSCCCLVIDLVIFSKYGFLQVRVTYLVSDTGSSITGLFLCYVGCFVNSMAKHYPLEESLLISDSSVSNINNSNRGNENLTGYSNAGIFSMLTFSWISPLITLGNKKENLDHKDLPQLAIIDSASETFPAFRNKLEAECGSVRRVTNLQLVKVLVLSTWQEILLSGLLTIISICASSVGPYLIDKISPYIYRGDKSRIAGCILAMAFAAAKFVKCLSQRHCEFKTQQLGVRVQSMLAAMIYAKGLSLTLISCQSRNAEFINLMNVDAAQVHEVCQHMHQPWATVLQVVLALLSLYRSIGVVSVAVFAATVILMLLTFPVVSFQRKARGRVMEYKDKRMKETSETLMNMRILKLLVWEKKFLSKIIQHRKTEVKWLNQLLIGRVFGFFSFNAPTYIAVVTPAVFALIGIPLENTGKISSAIAAFQNLQAPISKLPETISTFVEAAVSLERIASFLRLDDVKTNVVEKLPWGSSDVAVELVDGNFYWGLSSSHNTTLEDINLRVFHGMKVAVCGTVGSGKSTLLSCILGEVPKLSGNLKVSGTKAYVAQSPWIQSGKIEENILFGKEMDREKYEKVLEACSLTQDPEFLQLGNETIIGEKGINLTGGLKQKVQLARALYQDADMYLLDDPFSALDDHAGLHLFKECLLGYLETKTVIFVTHQVEFLPNADLILVMREGRITQSGKYNDILKSGTDFMEIADAYRTDLSSINKSLERSSTFETSSIIMKDTDFSTEIELEQIVERIDDRNGKSDDTAEQKGQLVQEEKREKGRVGFGLYWKYITIAHGGTIMLFVLLLYILNMMVDSIAISYGGLDHESLKYMLTKVALLIQRSLSFLVREVIVTIAGYKTATVLLENMHSCIFKAPMSFFDATPSGRILERASTDQTEIDMSIPDLAWGVTFILIDLLGFILTDRLFIIFRIPVIAASILCQRRYTASAQELARLAGMCQAPVIQHFSETISGSTTIRSFEQESRFIDINMKLIDRYSQPKLYSASAMQWVNLRVDILSSIIFTLYLIFTISNPIFTGIGFLGMAALNGNSILLDFIRVLSELESKLISVERLHQYSSIPGENTDDNQSVDSWPSFGKVQIQDLQVRYAPHSPLVLCGLTCTFTAGAKTVIVGRTGSGKSTLVHALSRLVKPDTGQILIDNIDISLVRTDELRSRLSIVSQEPMLFEGSVRTNLDPLGEYTNKQIWEVLDMCQLGDEVRKKEKKLDSIVTQNGENWSMGERQLLCLCRVLLRKSKILVFDEATSSIDTATDKIIQQKVKQHFSESTVIRVARRLTSILDNDMVLFLDKGRIQEYGSPQKLLEDKSSSLAQLVSEYTRMTNSGFKS